VHCDKIGDVRLLLLGERVVGGASANSVSPLPRGLGPGARWAYSMDSAAGTRRNEPSVCHKRLPSWSKRRGSSRPRSLLSASRFEMSATADGSRRFTSATPLRGSSNSPKFLANVIWRSSSRSWSRNTSTA
jgi:hypothetical protein